MASKALSASFLSVLLASGAPARGEEGSTPTQRADVAQPSAKVRQDLEAAAVRSSIERGLDYLRRKQDEVSGAVGSRFPVAVTSLSGLAVLGAGYRYRDGPFRDFLQGALKYIEKSSVDGGGYISDPTSRMHGHCYAVLFLTQLYGELPPKKQEDTGRLIRNGIRIILRAQTRAGGWYYTSNPGIEDEASVTICALQALRAANGSGFFVPKAPVDLAVKYVNRCKGPGGGFRYSCTLPDQHTSYGLTVAAISTLQAAGVYDSAEIKEGLDFARRRLKDYPQEPMKAAEREFFFYANLYAAQAFYQAGGDLWSSWYPEARRHLLRRQEGDGSWSDDYGVEFGTACALLILEIPLNYLPVFQR